MIEGGWTPGDRKKGARDGDAGGGFEEHVFPDNADGGYHRKINT